MLMQLKVRSDEKDQVRSEGEYEGDVNAGEDIILFCTGLAWKLKSLPE